MNAAELQQIRSDTSFKVTNIASLKELKLPRPRPVNVNVQELLQVHVNPAPKTSPEPSQLTNQAFIPPTIRKKMWSFCFHKNSPDWSRLLSIKL